MSTQRDTDYLIRSTLRSFLDGSLKQAAPECPDIGRSPPATHGVKELMTQNSSIGSMMSSIPNKKIDLFSKKSDCASSTSSEAPDSMMSMSSSNKASSEEDLRAEDFDPSDGREKPISESERLTKNAVKWRNRWIQCHFQDEKFARNTWTAEGRRSWI